MKVTDGWLMDQMEEFFDGNAPDLRFGEWDDYVWLIDPPDRTFANNAPRYDFECISCALACESHINETTIWRCPRCYHTLGESIPLRKTYRTSPSIPRVWHGHQSLTTGQWVSDRKQIKEQLHVASEERSERLQLAHNFIEVDMNDKDTLGITDEGLDATHDQHVRLGWKESKGRFVFPMSSPPNKKAE